MKHLGRGGAIIALLSGFLLPMSPASAATVTATGTNPGICNQTVSDATNVAAYRISGGDCVVEFKNVGTLNWTSPPIVQSAQVLVVAGGGGGGARHSGGGGGGGMLYVTNYKILANTSYSVIVGDGGAGAPGLSSSGAGNAGNNSSFAGTSGAGSLVANGGGGGGGGSNGANALNFNGSFNASPVRGSGGGSNHENSTSGTAAPGTTSDTNRAAGTYSMSINGVTASITAYGQAGGVGKGSVCYGPSTTYTGWCGGGGGGSWTDGGAPSQPGSVNPWRAGNGGSGASISITGTSTAYAGGGGGGSGSDKTFTTNSECVTNSPLPGSGGTGGGGTGGACLNTATSGTANTGGGGGGAGLAYVNDSTNTQGVGGKGGSGIVILRYTPDTTSPSFTSGTTFSFAENSSTSANAATIIVNESSTITINAGSDGALFVAVFADSVTARIRFSSSPNFESPTDTGANNQYDISIRATDLAGNYSDQSISITITNVNEAPTITAASGLDTYSTTKAENSTGVYNINATDVDSGTTLTYSLTGTDADDFTIGATGVLSFSPAPDFEDPKDSNRDNVYIVITWVSDGALSDSQTVTITVTNVNESSTLGAPTISGTAYKGVAISLTVTVNTPGKVRFFMDGKRISNCLAVSTTGSYPNYTATCNWKPAVTSRHNLSATFTPTDNTFSAASSGSAVLWVQKRTNTR